MKTSTLVLILCLACCIGSTLRGQAPERKETAAEKFEREQLGNVPVALHGKVVDQHNQPVPGVTVRLELEVGYLRTPVQGHTRWDKVELITDHEGRFSLVNRKAGSISIVALVKNDYEASAKNPRHFAFAGSGGPPHVPDPSSPVVFRVWKKHGAEPMFYVRLSGGIPCDGTSTNFDLCTGSRTSTNLNFKVSFNRVPLHPNRGAKYDSTITLEVVGGGIVQTADEFTLLAPDTGYQPSVTIARLATDPVWDRNVNGMFYLRTREGFYGRLRIELATFFDPPPTQFVFESFINPAGSRVLEYDSTKRIIPKLPKPK